MRTKKFKSEVEITKDAQSFIDGVMKELSKARQIEDMDMITLQLLATSYSQYLIAAKDIAKNGAIQKSTSGREYIRPMFEVMNKSMAKVENAINSLGLSPQSRRKIKTSIEDEPSALESFLLQE